MSAESIVEMTLILSLLGAPHIIKIVSEALLMLRTSCSHDPLKSLCWPKEPIRPWMRRLFPHRVLEKCEKVK